MDRLSIFATPIVVVELPGMDDINPALGERLLSERARFPGFQRSNIGGWHSVPDLSQRPEACYRTLIQSIVEQTGDITAVLAQSAGAIDLPRFRYGVQAWAMIMGDGDYTVVHDHGDAHWSSVYYVDAGDAPPGAHPMAGQLAFVDPRRGGRPIPGLDRLSSTFSVKPHTGMLVIFPGWLQHYVYSYRGSRPRISISCNLVLEAMTSAAPGPTPPPGLQ